jgi:hypothetical protein
MCHMTRKYGPPWFYALKISGEQALVYSHYTILFTLPLIPPSYTQIPCSASHFSNSFILYLSLNVLEEIWQPYGISGKIIVLYNSTFKYTIVRLNSACSLGKHET